MKEKLNELKMSEVMKELKWIEKTMRSRNYSSTFTADLFHDKVINNATNNTTPEEALALIESLPDIIKKVDPEKAKQRIMMVEDFIETFKEQFNITSAPPSP